MPEVDFKRQEVKDLIPQYDMITDALGGSITVKHKRTKYLPKPNPADTSEENTARYLAYLTRAVFYGVTRRTLNGLLGQLFYRDPIIEVPDALNAMIEDTTGEGVSAVQQAKKTAANVVPYGRAGLYTDYPTTNGQVTRAQLEEGGIRPTITVFDPYTIINWRTKKRGALSVLALVVLEELYTKADDGFKLEQEKQWRVLKLETGFNGAEAYFIEIWRKISSNFIRFSRVMPLKADGQPFEDIPFEFIGSENNDSQVDDPPLFDLADMNLAHYRNSADWEEGVFITNQPTPVLMGLSESWADKYFKTGVGLGSRAVIPLPENADAKYLQSEERTSAFEAMQHKERQMVALGAKLVEQKEVQRTATEADQEEAGETSVLATVANNISLAFVRALGWAAEFIGADPKSIKFEINTDFQITKASPAERAQTIKEWQAEAITWTEMRAGLRKAGSATLPDDEAEEEIRNANPLPNQKGGDLNPLIDPNKVPPKPE